MNCGGTCDKANEDGRGNGGAGIHSPKTTGLPLGKQLLPEITNINQVYALNYLEFLRDGWRLESRLMKGNSVEFFLTKEGEKAVARVAKYDLREMENLGLVQKEEDSTVPGGFRYAVTEYGLSLSPDYMGKKTDEYFRKAKEKDIQPSYSSTRQVFETLLQQMKNSATQHLTESYLRIKEDVAKWEGKTYGEFLNHFQRKDAYTKHHAMRMAVDASGRGSLWRGTTIKVRDDVDTYISQCVQRDLSEMFESFIEKQTEKTTDIIKGRPIKSIEGKIFDNLECRLHFELEDGSRFEMRCQIVWKFSSKGTRFWQFPTTFHNAVRADGTKIVQPSEAKLKAKF